jgi:hypothetical protein
VTEPEANHSSSNRDEHFAEDLQVGNVVRATLRNLVSTGKIGGGHSPWNLIRKRWKNESRNIQRKVEKFFDKSNILLKKPSKGEDHRMIDPKQIPVVESIVDAEDDNLVEIIRRNLQR